MLSIAMASITVGQLYQFHSMDRDIFSRLVIKFMRHPAESLLIMALWLWLEDKGFPNITIRMVDLSELLVNELANEAVLCLRFLESNAGNSAHAASARVLVLTSEILGRKISLQMFNQHRYTAITGVKYFLNNTCARIFTDILEFVVGGTGLMFLNRPLVIPGFPHPLFGDFTVIPQSLVYGLPEEELWGWHPSDSVPDDERTLFLTFSRGFPVSEEEVREVFTDNAGDCVESIHMEDVPSSEQSLYAKMVLFSVTLVDRILNGKRISKFRVNGKHIWARKYENRGMFQMSDSDWKIGNVIQM